MVRTAGVHPPPCRRARLIKPNRFQLGHQLAQFVIDILGRIPFIASAPNGDRRMVAKAQNLLANIGQINLQIYGIRSVARVGLKELIPKQDAILVAHVVEIRARALAHPVTDHRVIGKLVHANLRFQPFARIALHGFVHAPVAALAEHAHAIHRDCQILRLRHRVGNLADAKSHRLLIRNFPTHFELQLKMIQVLRAITIGPPKPRFIQMQCRNSLGVNRHQLRSMRCQLHRHLKRDMLKAPLQNTFLRLVGDILHRGLNAHVSRVQTRQRQIRRHQRIFHQHRAGRPQKHLLPNAAVAVANARNPVPADGAQKRRAIAGGNAAVEPQAIGNGVLIRISGVGLRRNAHGQGGFFSRSHYA